MLNALLVVDVDRARLQLHLLLALVAPLSLSFSRSQRWRLILKGIWKHNGGFMKLKVLS